MNVGIILPEDLVRRRDPEGPGSLLPDMLVVQVDTAPEGYAQAHVAYFDGAEHVTSTLPCADLVPVNPPEEALRVALSAGEEIALHFEFRHLPAKLALVSRRYAHLAGELLHALPRCAERTVALRKLLESKDCAVRAARTR